jgi:hypothetical protein
MAVWGYRSDLFVNITTSGPSQYVKLVESYRDTSGVQQQRVIATLGHIEAVPSGEADSLLNGLLRAAARPSRPINTSRLPGGSGTAVNWVW